MLAQDIYEKIHLPANYDYVFEKENEIDLIFSTEALYKNRVENPIQQFHKSTEYTAKIIDPFSGNSTDSEGGENNFGHISDEAEKKECR